MLQDPPAAIDANDADRNNVLDFTGSPYSGLDVPDVQHCPENLHSKLGEEKLLNEICSSPLGENKTPQNWPQ